MTATKAYVVRADQAGQRLDLVVGDLLGLSRQRVRELFSTGCVRVSGRPVAKGTVAIAGLSLSVVAPPRDVAHPQPELALDVCAECDDYVIVNKAPGQASVAHRGSDRDTLANALVGRYPELGSVGSSALESGLVHRLDSGTSGLLVAARNPEAHARLSGSLRRSEWLKRYLAIIDAPLPEPAGELQGFLAPARHSSKRVAFSTTPSHDGRAYAASCTWRCRQVSGALTLVEVESAKAYRHQVRVLLAALGCPLVGDGLYGSRSSLLPPHRHALHASFVAWQGDGVIPGFSIEAQLPPDLAELLAPQTAR